MQEEKKKKIEEEMDDLRDEMESFQKEKERVRSIVGKIGGVPDFNTKTFNILFLVLIAVCLFVALVTSGTLRFATLELAIAALSAKIIYMIHNQHRVNHFQLWILTSLEWRLNEILKAIKENLKNKQQ